MGEREIAERLFEVWQGDLSAIDAAAHPEIEVRYPLLPRPVSGREAYRRTMSRVHEHFPDFRFAADPPIVDADRVVISWSGGGTHSGTLLGVPATGRPVSFSGVSLYRVRDGLVIEERGEEDTYAILRQIGGLAVN